MKFLLEVLVLPLMVCAAAAARDGWDDLQKNVAMHCGMSLGSVQDVGKGARRNMATSCDMYHCPES